MRYLMEASSNVEAKDASGRTALMHAALNGNIELVKALIEKVGARSDHIDANGWTLSMIAAWGGELRVLRYLVGEVNTYINKWEVANIPNIGFNNYNYFVDEAVSYLEAAQAMQILQDVFERDIPEIHMLYSFIMMALGSLPQHPPLAQRFMQSIAARRFESYKISNSIPSGDLYIEYVPSTMLLQM
mmetsp:Transcript_5162/g.6340  ORF Transcript_5162/g.6340 Transcript_5162/m.6340 type:complete len:187 (-) Transcript_5162:58-618(-)|eukprot:jgi/Bigna1/61907/fgenesh1_kg.28_\